MAASSAVEFLNEEDTNPKSLRRIFEDRTQEYKMRKRALYKLVQYCDDHTFRVFAHCQLRGIYLNSHPHVRLDFIKILIDRDFVNYNYILASLRRVKIGAYGAYRFESNRKKSQENPHGDLVFFNVIGPAEASSSISSNSPMDALVAAQRSILIAEDDGSIRYCIVGAVEGLGLAVVETSNGQEAWERFAAEPSKYALVITDCNMLQMGGLALANNIRGISKTVPIVMLTDDSQQKVQDAFNQGVTIFLSKWFVDMKTPSGRKELGRIAGHLINKKFNSLRKEYPDNVNPEFPSGLGVQTILKDYVEIGMRRGLPGFIAFNIHLSPAYNLLKMAADPRWAGTVTKIEPKSILCEIYLRSGVSDEIRKVFNEICPPALFDPEKDLDLQSLSACKVYLAAKPSSSPLSYAVGLAKSLIKYWSAPFDISRLQLYRGPVETDRRIFIGEFAKFANVGQARLQEIVRYVKNRDLGEAELDEIERWQAIIEKIERQKILYILKQAAAWQAFDCTRFDGLVRDVLERFDISAEPRSPSNLRASFDKLIHKDGKISLLRTVITLNHHTYSTADVCGERCILDAWADQFEIKSAKGPKYHYLGVVLLPVQVAAQYPKRFWMYP